MRIDFHPAAQPTPETERSSSRTQASVTASSTDALAGDQAQLSAGHAQVQALAAQAAQLPEVREERVQALRQAVVSGQYHPAPSDVAHALVKHLLVSRAA